MTLIDVMTEDLQRLHAAEREQTRTLRLMGDAVATEQLQRTLREHLKQTEGQVQRLESILDELGVKPAGPVSRAAEGLAEDAAEIMGHDADDEVVDLEIIAAAQKTEHFEMACYQSALEMAREMGMDGAVRLLGQTLEEERRSSRLLEELARPLLKTAAEAEMTEVEAEDDRQ